MSIVIKSGLVLGDSFSFMDKDLKIEGEKISDVGSNLKGEVIIDGSDMYVIPGLIDIHTHGCAGCDFCDGEISSLEAISRHLGKNGITSYLGTSMALSGQRLEEIFKVARDFIKENNSGAYMHGIHMEGPFFSKEKKGAQPEDNFLNPNVDFFDRLSVASGGNIKVISMAPELEGSIDFISKVKDEVTISLAHTTASFETTIKAIQAGAKSVTHLYNAMPPYTHRNPGVIGAAYDSDVNVELICDGVHVHPAVIRSTFKTVSSDRVVLVSDSMSACGMEDGTYELGGQKVVVKSGAASLENGTIAGSTTNLMDCVKNCVGFGIPLEQAVKAATINPAKLVGVSEETGSLTEGKYADIVLLDKELNVRRVFVKGKELL